MDIGTSQRYRDLGLRRVVNASDTLTVLGGGRLSPGVLEAMTQAAAHHIDIPDLLAATGRHLAELTRNEAALVVGGAAAGLAVATAGAIAGTDPALVDALPADPPPRSEVVLMRAQRNPYDRAISQTGARIVEIGYFDATPEHQFRSALNERTAAVVWFAGTQFEWGALPLERTVAIAHEAGVPVIVDAAAQLPPVENLWHYTVDLGADLVVFSGGKGLRGPQNSGLVLGRADLVEAAAANTYPRHSTGRSMKTSKESILGLVAAVEEALATDWEAARERWEAIVATVVEHVGALEGVSAWRVPTGRLGQAYPRAFVRWEHGPADAAALAAAMASGLVPVVIGHDDARDKCVYVNPFSLLEGEAEVVVQRLVDELAGAR